MRLRGILALCVSALYALAVAAAIILLSGSPYDFMIGADDNGHKMTACDLPTPSDDVSGFYAVVTCMLVLVLLITGLARSVRGRRPAPSMVLGVALLALWAYEFFGPTLGCARVPA
jgi:glycerol uptake facilitator-like aquaporin